jgi:tRNA nucleotidyltransferase/poly(A) polymerase
MADALGAAYYPLDESRGFGRVVFEPQPNERSSHRVHLDFATFQGESLLEDLQARDFTINALAISLTDPPRLIDPLAGQRDLETGQIKAASPAAFQHDPVRVIRAVRQAVEFDFSIEARTEKHLQQAGPGLIISSPERKREELVKLLNTPAPGRAVQRLAHYHLLPYLLPEVEAMQGVSQQPPHYLNVFDHTTRALDAWAAMLKTGLPDLLAGSQPQIERYLDKKLAGELTRRELMPWALLWHDVGKPLTRTGTGSKEDRIRFIGHERASADIARRVMKEFRFSNQAIDFVGRVIANHMRPLLLAADGGKISRRVIYRYFRATNDQGEQTGVAVLLHALADHQATYPPGSIQEQTARALLLAVSRQLLAAYFEARNRVVDPEPLLTGRDLIDEFGLTPGPLIGRLLARLIEAQATGQVGDRASALAFIENDPDLIESRSKSDV